MTSATDFQMFQQICNYTYEQEITNAINWLTTRESRQRAYKCA